MKAKHGFRSRLYSRMYSGARISRYLRVPQPTDKYLPSTTIHRQFFSLFFFFSPPREKQRQFVDIDSSDNSISKEWQPRTDLPRQRSAWSPLCWEICVPTTRIAPSPTASARTGAAFAPRDTRRPATGRNVSVNSILPFFPFSRLLHTYMHLNPFLAKRGSRFSLLK